MGFLIVFLGGGIGGLSAGIALKRAGWDETFLLSLLGHMR